MFICKHEVQYYETDRMGITHHSNYVRWMEEARTFFLREIGWPYEKIEEEGIISPVTSISCDYKATSTFADQISIEINVKSVKSAKLSFVYHMVNQNGVLVCTAASEHSFLSKDGGFVNLKRDYPSFFNLLKTSKITSSSPVLVLPATKTFLSPIFKNFLYSSFSLSEYFSRDMLNFKFPTFLVLFLLAPKLIILSLSISDCI